MALISNTQETSLEAYDSIKSELGLREKQVLDALYTLGTANNKMISVALKLSVNQVTGRIKELRDMKFVTFSHHSICPFNKRNTMYWRVTKFGEMMAEKLDNIELDILVMKPFHTFDGNDYIRFTSQIKSSNTYKFYNVELKAVWDYENKQYYFKKFCECEGFRFRGDCKHCLRLENEIKRWNEI